LARVRHITLTAPINRGSSGIGGEAVGGDGAAGGADVTRVKMSPAVPSYRSTVPAWWRVTMSCGCRGGGVAEDEHVGESLPGLVEGAGEVDPGLRVRPGGTEPGLVQLAGGVVSGVVGGGGVRDRRPAELRI